MSEQTSDGQTADRGSAGREPTDDLVSCLPIAALFDEVERRGLDPSFLARDVDRSIDFLRSRRNRMRWDELRTIVDRLPDHFSEAEIVDIGRCLVHTEAQRPFGLVARYTMSVGGFYRAVFSSKSVWGRPMFPVFDSTFVQLAPGTYEATLVLHHGVETSAAFEVATKGGIIGMSEVLGSPPPVVDIESIERGVRYRIRVPEEPSPRTRLRDQLGLPFRSREIATELRDAHESLRARYDALQDVMVEREAAADALRQSEHRLRVTLESAEMGIWDFDAVTGSITVDDVARSILGLDDDVRSLTPRMLLAMVHDDDRTSLEQDVRTLRSGAQARRFRVRVDGSVRTLVTRGHGFFDASGRPTRFTGVVQDVSEEVERIGLDDRLARAVADSPFEVYVADADTYRFVDVNEVARRNLGYTLGELGGMTPVDLGAFDDERALHRVVGPLTTGGTDRAVELVSHRRANGTTYPVELRLHLSVVGTRRVLVAIGVDLTDRRRADRERRELEHQLWQVQKLEALGTLAGGISHDFNNLLMAIAGYSELVARSLPEDSKERGYLDRIRRATDDGKALAGQLLTFSRAGGRRREPVRLGPIVREAVGDVAASMPADISIGAEIDDDVSPVAADAGQIAQIVDNLCSNAAFACAPGDPPIEVVLEQVDLDETTAARFAGLHRGPHVGLSVTDRGRGIAPELKERVFDPFFTTKDSDGGAGLGLAVVHGIVRAHHGAIDIESEPGAGTTVRVLLPCHERDADPTPPGGSDEAAGTGRVLLVDDEDAVADLLALGLEGMGYEVGMFRDGESALAAFTREPSSFDLVVTDQTMPAMTGLELASQLRRIRSDVPIVLISGLGDATVDDSTARRIGITEVLTKPFALVELSTALHRAGVAGSGTDRSVSP